MAAPAVAQHQRVEDQQPADRLAQAENAWRPFRIDGRLGNLYDRVATLVAQTA